MIKEKFQKFALIEKREPCYFDYNITKKIKNNFLTSEKNEK